MKHGEAIMSMTRCEMEDCQRIFDTDMDDGCFVDGKHICWWCRPGNKEPWDYPDLQVHPIGCVNK